MLTVFILLFSGKRGSKYEVELKDEAPVNREKKLSGELFCSTQEGIWAVSQHSVAFYAFRNNVNYVVVLRKAVTAFNVT